MADDCTGMVPHQRGADLSVKVRLYDTRTGIQLPVHSLTATLFEVEPSALAASMSVLVYPDAPPDPGDQDAILVTCPWSSSWPDGVGQLVAFRVKLSDGSAIPRIPVLLK